MKYKNDRIIMGDSFSDEYMHSQTDTTVVQNIIKAANAANPGAWIKSQESGTRKKVAVAVAVSA